MVSVAIANANQTPNKLVMEDVLTECIPFLLGLISILVAYICWKRSKNIELQDETNEVPPKDEEKVVEEPVVKNAPKSKKAPALKRKEVKDTYSHPWLLASLKGHSDVISDLDFSSNGKQLASCAEDRAVMLWNVKTFSEKNHRSVRANIEFDHATRIKWSPDTKAFIVSTATGNTVEVYKIGKKSDGSLGNIEMILKFPENHHADIINIGIACNGHFIMSCSSDTNLIVWDLKGEVLATIDTLHINNYYACVSPCGRFVASSGFTPDVRVWEICFGKDGKFKEVKRAFELKGHTSGVYHFSFSNDSSRMATISKDGTWKLWNTNIEYDKGQEPYLLKTCQHGINSKSNFLIALSPDGRTIAVAPTNASNLFIYSAVTLDLQAELKDIHYDSIRAIQFSPIGQYIAVAVGRHIRVFHNIPGYKNVILDLEESKKNATNASLKDRLQSQIDEAKLLLKKLEEC